MGQSSSAAKLLARLRDTKVGWTPRELYQVLEGHGFTRKKQARHGTFFEHPDYPADTTVIIPRHTPCKTWVAVKVLKAVESVISRQDPT
jgi:hypothetical protein